MTDVWMTRSGGKYHGVPDCQGIVDGHAKAASEGFPNYPAKSMSLSTAAATVQPCLRCWGEKFKQDRWLAPALETELIGDSEYELDFLNSVLKRTSIDPEDIQVQYETNGSSGRRYRIDFAIVRSGLPNVAIGIDGFQKDKKRNEADETRQADTAARQNDLTAAGWIFLRFTNRQVTTYPGGCRMDIEKVVAQHVPTPQTPSPPVFTHPATSTGPSHGSAPQPPDRSWPKYLVGVVAAVAVLGVVIALVSSPDDTDDSGSVTPSGSSCPDSHPVKGNVAGNGEAIYHEQGWRYYDATIPEECFKSAEDAEAGGYRASEVH